MRFVEVATEQQQVSAMAYRTRQMFIGQRGHALMRCDRTSRNMG